MSGVEAGIDRVMTQLLRGHIVSSTVTKHKAVPSEAQNKPPHSAVLACFCSPDVGNKETQVSGNPEIHVRSDFTFKSWNMFFKKII